MSATDQEVELKFVLPDGEAEAVWAAIGGAEARPAALTSVYFDTAKRRLRKAGVALRVREKKGVFVQTVKSGGGVARGEWETAISTAAPDRRALAGTPAAALLPRKADLVPAFSVRVQRRAVELTEGRSRIEACIDVGDIRAGGRSTPVREIELELLHGEVGDLFALARRLMADAPLTLSFASKAARGYELADGEAPEPPPLDEAMTAAEGLQALGLAALADLSTAIQAFLAGPDVEPVHQIRVALRRLRGAVSTFKSVCADDERDAVNSELKWLAGQFDAARDLDVLLQYGLPALPDIPQALVDRVKVARGEAYAAAEHALDSLRTRALLLNTLQWLSFGAWTERDSPPLKAFAAERLDKRRGKMRERGARLADLSPEERHHLRIDGKKLRYDSEALGGLFNRPKRARKLITALKGLQDVLGALNDAQAGAGRLEALAEADETVREAALAAAEALRDQQGAGDKAAHKAWRRFDEAKAFWP
jgi:inorganic triphosphatase YgiF